MVADGLHLHKTAFAAFDVRGYDSGVRSDVGAGFRLLAVLVLLYAAFNASIIPLADNSVLTCWEMPAPIMGDYASGEPLGFGTAAFGAGVLAERLGLPRHHRHLHRNDEHGGIDSHEVARAPGRPRVFFGAQSQRICAGFAVVGLHGFDVPPGFCFSVLNNYFSIYLKSIGAGEALIGLGVAAAGVSELPIFWLSP